MTSRRRITYVVFFVCSILVLEGLGWVTYRMLRSEREARQAEVVRNALWRMESAVAPLIASESARPYFQYLSVFPAEGPFARMLDGPSADEPVALSPLFTGPVEFVRLHFQVGDDGALTSPQAPEQELTERLVGYSAPSSIVDARDLLGELERIVTDQRSAGRAPEPAETRSRTPSADLDKSTGEDGLGAKLRREADRADALAQLEDPDTEYQARQSSAQQLRSANVASEPQVFADAFAEKSEDEAAREVVAGSVVEERARSLVIADEALVTTGPLRPVWWPNPVTGGQELMFIRDVEAGGTDVLQGFWVDWPSLRTDLLRRVADLLPDAQLLPATRTGPVERRLASIPAQLEPGPILPLASITPTRVTLGVTWLAVLGGLVAIGLVLRAALALSERRGRFVSAVTHELRTPLTTFCLYTQMLADGMVPDEQKKQQYVETLKRESVRLAGLVENVLEYARLGRPSRTNHDASPIGELLDETIPTLRERAERAGMTLEIDRRVADDVRVRISRASFARIMGNLVENATKYACDADDKRIRGTVERHAGRVELLLWDHGPGIPPGERRRVFVPFQRSRRDEQTATPGLGLGLALARGLARQAGGDLQVVQQSEVGAKFRVVLRVIA